MEGWGGQGQVDGEGDGPVCWDRGEEAGETEGEGGSGGPGVGLRCRTLPSTPNPLVICPEGGGWKLRSLVFTLCCLRPGNRCSRVAGRPAPGLSYAGFTLSLPAALYRDLKSG